MLDLIDWGNDTCLGVISDIRHIGVSWGGLLLYPSEASRSYNGPPSKLITYVVFNWEDTISVGNGNVLPYNETLFPN